MVGKNSEGYHDPTANIAIGRVAKEEKRKQRKKGGENKCGKKQSSDSEQSSHGVSKH